MAIQRLSVIALLLITAAATEAVADEAPCGRIRFADGEILLERGVALQVPLADEAKRCLSAVAGEITDRPSIRALTVAVRLPDEERSSGRALAMAKAVADELLGSGVPARLVSVVAPAIGRGESPGLRLAYRERRSTRAVAQVLTLTGAARMGRTLDTLTSVEPGARLVAHDYLQTEENAHAIVTLADGSILHLGPLSLLRVGPIYLTKDLQRQVRLELARGTVETVVKPGTGGSVFQLVTRAAVAGVRGTEFRTTVEDGDVARLETSSGSVELANDQGGTVVTGGFGSRAARGQKPEPPRPLLPAAMIQSPIMGSISRQELLRWQAVPGASRYVVELARNARFTLERSEVYATTTSTAIAPGLPDGKWFWRVRAIDADGFIGQVSKIYAFAIAPSP